MSMSGAYTMSFIEDLSRALNHQRPTSTGPDGYPIFADDELDAIQRALHTLVEVAADPAHTPAQLDPDLALSRWPKPQELILASVMRCCWIARYTFHRPAPRIEAIERVLTRQRPQHYANALTSASLGFILTLLAQTQPLQLHHRLDWAWWMRLCEEHVAAFGLRPDHVRGLKALRLCFDPHSPQDLPTLWAIDRLLADLHQPHLELGEPWTDHLMAELDALDEDSRAPWEILLGQLPTSSARPSARWLKRQRAALDGLDEQAFTQLLLRLLPLVHKKPSISLPSMSADAPEATLIRPRNEELLRGLVFASTLIDDEALYAALSDLAISCYRKLPELGPRSPRLGNACISALALAKGPSAVGYLARLKLRLGHYTTTQRLIERAIEEAAQLHDLSTQELQDLAAPTLGLDDDGCWRLEVGDYLAEISVDAHLKTHTRWIRQAQQGQTQLIFLLEAPTPQEILKTPPKAARDEHPELVAQVEWTARELEKLLLVQRDRLEGFFLQQRQWSYESWRTRFVDHPLVNHIARGLIWEVGQGAAAQLVFCLGDALINSQNQHLPTPPPKTPVRLWHPAASSWAELNIWRRFLTERKLLQPFKQAFRERFDPLMGPHPLASHTFALRQHQLAALCKSQGWEYRLQGRWECEPYASRALPQGHTAKLWLRPVRELAFSTHQGVYLYVLTEAITFEDAHHQPVDLTQLDTAIFSEVMRDLELFLAVAANEPDATLQKAILREGLGAAQAPALEATLTLRRDTLRRIITNAQLQDRCIIKDSSLLIMAKSQKLTLDLRTGQPPKGSPITLDPQTKKSAQALVEERLPCPYEPDATLAHLLRLIAQLLWGEPSPSSQASLGRRFG